MTFGNHDLFDFGYRSILCCSKTKIGIGLLRVGSWQENPYYERNGTTRYINNGCLSSTMTNALSTNQPFATQITIYHNSLMRYAVSRV